jgi:hypothetical protein
LGVSPALIASLECGRRRITKRRAEEIARLFGGNLYRRQPAAVQNTVTSILHKTASSQRLGRAAERPTTALAQRLGNPPTLVDLLRGFTGAAPVRVTKPASGPALPPSSASAPGLVSESVQAEPHSKAPVSNPASAPRPLPVVAWSKCTWRDPEFGLCDGLTPQGMLYCAVHMTLAMIEGRPTRRL